MKVEVCVSHSSPTTGEEWGTQRLVAGTKVAKGVSRILRLAKNERDAPNFLHAVLEKTTCAPFFKERDLEFLHFQSQGVGGRTLGTLFCSRLQA
jgi:hypothetical protein